MTPIKIKEVEVLRMNNKSLLLLINDEVQAYATKRVANEILAGNTEFVFTETRYFADNTTWLATPSVF